MSVTMKQVAAKAGVSDTTVARVLDNYTHISPEIIRRVKQTIKELGYVPVRKPRNHKKLMVNSKCGLKTGLVGFLLVQWTPDYLLQPLMMEIMTSTERHLAAKNLQMVFTQIPNSDVLPETMTAGRLDGVLVMGQASLKLHDALAGHNVILMLGGPRHTGGDYWADAISSDYPACGNMAAQYLIDRGHKNIVYLNPISNHGGFQEIGWTFQATALNHNVQCQMLACDFHSLATGIWNRKQAQEAMYDQFKIIAEMSIKDRPTGLHIPADDFALLAYEVLKDMGIKPGVDMEVISRRNQEMYLSQMDPRPATIDINTDEMGRWATETLLRRIANPNAPVGSRLLVPPKLILPS
jgi:DNA-binding LacI/PurR family transcriptional regulator